MHTCHEAVHMEERHDQERAVARRQLISGHDVDEAGRQIGVR